MRPRRIWWSAAAIVAVSVAPVVPLGAPQVVGTRLVPVTERISVPVVQVRRPSLVAWLQTLAAGDGSAEEARRRAWRAAADVIGPVLLVRGVALASPAAGRVTADDAIVAVGGQAPSRSAIDAALASGASVELTLLRAGRVRTAVLTPTPPWPQLSLGGIDAITGTLDGLESPPIGLGDAHGGSGGLGLALAFVDLVTPGELTGRRPIAATGVLDARGGVLDVLGLRYKRGAAEAAGVPLLLIPALQRGDPAADPGFTRGTVVVGVGSVEAAVRLLCAAGGTSTACPDDSHR